MCLPDTTEVVGLPDKDDGNSVRGMKKVGSKPSLLFYMTTSNHISFLPSPIMHSTHLRLQETPRCASNWF